MQFLEHFKIGGSWISSGILYAVLAIAIVVMALKWASLTNFISEVRGELRKASWPWESDPKIKGFKKYKELVDSTIVVLIATILLAGFVSMWDFICIYVLNFVTSFGQ